MMDVDRLLKLHQDWVEAMPSVAPFYATKVNPDPLLLKTLIALGCGFDCASKVFICLGGMRKDPNSTFKAVIFYKPHGF